MRVWRGSCFVVGLLLATAVPAAAQTTVLIRGGASVSTLGGDDADGAGNRTALSIGGAVSFGLGGNLGVQVGGAFVQKGASIFLESEGIDASIKLGYIEVPVLLQLSIPTEGPISPRFFAGPAISFEAGCDVEGTLEGVTVSAPCGDAGIGTTSIDFGALGGAGLGIATSAAASVTLDVMYNLGLSTIDDSASPDDVKNRSWSFLAGVALPLG